MKFIVYIFFRLYKYYGEDNRSNSSVFAFINLVSLLLINFFSFFLLLSSLFHIDVVDYFLSLSTAVRKTALVVLVIIVNLIFYLLWIVMKKKLVYLFESLQQMDGKKTKQYKLYFVIYLVITAMFLLFSILSGALFK